MNSYLTARNLSVAAGISLALGLAGCASVPHQNAELEIARTEVAAARNNGNVSGDARVELGRAEEALGTADAMLLAGKPTVEVDHQAYLADRYARAAQAHGSLLASEKRIATQEARRNSVLLAARERDVTRANAVAADMGIQARNSRASAEASAVVADIRMQEANDARADAAVSAAESVAANERATRLDAQLTELQGRHTDRGVVVTLGDVLFSSGQSDLREGSGRAISRLTTFLSEHPARTIRIEGFTDSVGSESSNMSLSERRAASVGFALTRGGIDPIRIHTQGYGTKFAIAGNETPLGRQQNRRVEVVVSDNDKPVLERTR